MDKTSNQAANHGKGLMMALMVLPFLIGFTAPVYAGISKGGAFIGGLLAGHVVTGAVQRSKRRTQAEEYQAYAQPQPVAQQAAPAPSAAPAAQPSAEQRIQQLDKLAAGGYISPEEYKAKKQSILNSL
jgi:predicted lipid-binding transport protein (Tim44 family)